MRRDRLGYCRSRFSIAGQILLSKYRPGAAVRHLRRHGKADAYAHRTCGPFLRTVLPGLRNARKVNGQGASLPELARCSIYALVMTGAANEIKPGMVRGGGEQLQLNCTNRLTRSAPFRKMIRKASMMRFSMHASCDSVATGLLSRQPAIFSIFTVATGSQLWSDS
jgi:hypothetical protein